MTLIIGTELMIGAGLPFCFGAPIRSVPPFTGEVALAFARAVEALRWYGLVLWPSRERLGALPTPPTRGLCVDGPAEGVEVKSGEVVKVEFSLLEKFRKKGPGDDMAMAIWDGEGGRRSMEGYGGV